MWKELYFVERITGGMLNFTSVRLFVKMMGKGLWSCSFSVNPCVSAFIWVSDGRPLLCSQWGSRSSDGQVQVQLKFIVTPSPFSPTPAETPSSRLFFFSLTHPPLHRSVVSPRLVWQVVPAGMDGVSFSSETLTRKPPPLLRPQEQHFFSHALTLGILWEPLASSIKSFVNLLNQRSVTKKKKKRNSHCCSLITAAGGKNWLIIQRQTNQVKEWIDAYDLCRLHLIL